MSQRHNAPVMSFSADSSLADLCVKSAGTSNSGVTYFTISVQTIYGDEWGVEKRYSEFEDLRLHLANKGIEATSFPGKHLFRSNTQSVIQERIVGFTKFLREVVAHQTKRQSVQRFLRLDKMVRRDNRDLTNQAEGRDFQGTGEDAPASPGLSPQFYDVDEEQLSSIEGSMRSTRLTDTLSPEDMEFNTVCGQVKLTQLFQLLDMDRSGTLEVEELKVVHGSDKQLEAFFATWDADHNRSIDIHEFIAYFKDFATRKGVKALNILIGHWNTRAQHARILQEDLEAVHGIR